MVAIYRSLLYLYPSAYRDEYGEEMIAVFCEVQAEIENKGSWAQFVFCAREAGGLLFGALQEHFRSVVGSYGDSRFASRGLTIRSEFRFPKATVALMAVILAGVMVAIEKARAIQSSVPYANPYVGPIRDAQFTVLPAFLLILVAACIAGSIGWATLFAMHRSGVQRFSAVDPVSGQPSGTKLSNRGSMFASRRLTIHSEFRFPRATIALMAVILAGVMVAIDKARAIQVSVPYANPQVGPIQPAQFTVLPAFLLIFVAACITASIGWAILFALHRSGVQRFSAVNLLSGQRSGTKLSL